MYQPTGSTLRGSVVAICGTAFVLVGYDQGLIGGVNTLPSFRAQFKQPDANLDGIIASIYDIGCVVGSIFAFLLADKLGCKRSIAYGSATVLFGTVLQTSASERIQLITSRVITGIGNGFTTCVVPVWQAETLKSDNRGALLIIQSASLAFGQPLNAWLALVCISVKSSFSWRFPIAFQGVMSIMVLSGLPFVTESPRWLISKDRFVEATKVIARLRGHGASVFDPEVIADRDYMVRLVDQERAASNASWTELFAEGKKRNLSRLLLGIGPYLFNQWSGINTLAYFLPVSFEKNIGLSQSLSLIISGVLGTQFFLASIIPYFFIERVGRRKLLMLSSGGCSLCMATISIALAVNTKISRGVFVASAFLYFDIFSWGILPVSWMYAPEIMPLQARTRGVALAVALHWLSNFAVVYITPMAINSLGLKLYIIWAGTCASFVPIVYLFYPETAGRTLEEVDDIFASEKFGFTKTRSPLLDKVPDLEVCKHCGHHIARSILSG